MKTADMVIKNGTIIYSSGAFKANLIINDGKIVSVTSASLNSISAREEIDASNMMVLPGIIDTHVHAREPGRAGEDFTTCTKAAANGGVTTILAMPTCNPATTTVNLFRERKKIAERKSIVDFGLYGSAGMTNVESLGMLAKEGIVAFKTFLKKPEEKYRESFSLPDDRIALEVFSEIAKTNKMVCVHAEDDGTISYATDRILQEKIKDPSVYESSRPVSAEIKGAVQAVLLAKETNVRLNLCHVSAGSVIEAISLINKINFKDNDPEITVETCPHYLFLTNDVLGTKGPYGVVKPPLRSKDEQDKLWRYLNCGMVQTIGSDHAPYPRELKERGWDDIFLAPAGAPGLEASLPLMLTAVAEKRLSIERYVELMSENAAKLYGIYPRKGILAPGSDADIVLVDPAKRYQLDHNNMFTQCRDSALVYDGLKVIGMPILTIVRGTIVMRDGEIIGKPGYGRFIPSVS